MVRDKAIVLREILDAIEIARESVTTVRDLAAFEQSRVNRAATERAIEIISEAVCHLPDDVLARHSSVPWVQIKAIGNKVRHEYHRVEPKIIWDAVAHDLGPLEAVIRAELANIG